MDNATGSGPGQYLSFRLADEIFGINVSHVREILNFTKLTKIPQMPAFMCGVINLRGNVVPVIDMRIKLKIEAEDTTVDSCIVVVEVNLEGGLIVLGVLVDSVQEVFELEEKDVEAPPAIGTRLNTEFIKGLGKKEGEFVIILNIDKVFSIDELEAASLAEQAGTDEDA